MPPTNVWSLKASQITLMMAATDDGILMFTPKDMNDEDGKDTFANTVRMIAGTYGASSLVLILESWMTRASQEGNLDMTPPSESYEREEVVTLIGQSAFNVPHSHTLIGER